MIQNQITQTVGQQQPSLVIQTITCDLPACDKTVTYDVKDRVKVVAENPWLNTVRVVERADGQRFLYCSDECEIAAVGAGNHNTPEPKKLVSGSEASTVAAIVQAAAAAKAAKEATQKLKDGAPVTLHSA